MYNPTLSAVYGYNTLHLFKKRTAINMGLITHCSCKAWEFFTTIQPNLEQNIYISFMYVSDYFTKHGQSSIPSRRREESRWQRWCEAWLSRFQSWDLTELQKWILWSIRYDNGVHGTPVRYVKLRWNLKNLAEICVGWVCSFCWTLNHRV